MAEGGKPPGFWDRVKEAPLWAKIAAGVVLLIAVISAIPVEEDSENGGDETTTEAVATEAPAQPEAGGQPESGPTNGEGLQEIDDALGDADPTEFGAVASDLNVKFIEQFSPDLVNLTLETPEGGFEGTSPEDLDGSAGAAFAAIYGDADWQGGATVQFTGGLTDTRTGQDLPNERTGLYRVRAGEARQIDWDNATGVDWSLYRLFVHPAIEE